jgi:P27 family predicted phage terminase small subunit
MAKPGPKPTPTKLKIIRGNPGKRKINDAEPVTNMLLAEPPEHLSGEALKEWHRVAGELNSMGVITGIDAAVLAAYCQSYGRWVEAERVLTKMKNSADGLLIKTTNGNYIQNPLVGIANKSMADMVKYSTEMGMTPSSRSGIKIANNNEPANPFAALHR